MEGRYLVAPQEPPPLNIPESSNTVKVSVIDTTSRFRIPMAPFLQPDYKGHDNLCGPALSFLIEHPVHKPVLFDLGIRKDWHVLPSYPKWLDLQWHIHVDKDVADILRETRVDVDGGAIGSIIWSHHHWDHVGDASTFPGSTDLVVGPGFIAAHLPGFPTNRASTLMETDFAGRQIREVKFDDGAEPFRIGRFRAHDFFGDGSFYLLDTPGHSIGHICGLARTTAGPSSEASFVFMGGDAAHHGGEFRPTPYLPLPAHLTPSPLPRVRPGSCPGEVLRDMHPHQCADRPFYYVTENFAHDKKVADWTIDGLGEFDARPEVLMLMAHDDAVVDPAAIDFFPASLNEWRVKGLGEKLKWRFLEDFQDAAQEKDKGGEAFTWGKYP